MIYVRELSAWLQQSSCAMKTILDRRGLLLALALAFAGSRVAYSDDRDHDDDDDHDQARRALEEGRVRPFADILARVAKQLGGEVIGVEFERETGRDVYEFKVVTPSGRLREVYVDAMTAEILNSEHD
jgi:uncharacterized membrane protein YkoI